MTDHDDFRARRLHVPDTVLFQVVGDESILLNLDTEYYFGLDDIGSDILQALVEAETVGEALDVLTLRFGVAPATMRRDLQAFVDELEASGLLADRP